MAEAANPTKFRGFKEDDTHFTTINLSQVTFVKMVSGDAHVYFGDADSSPVIVRGESAEYIKAAVGLAPSRGRKKAKRRPRS